jgi:hypothetical protein
MKRVKESMWDLQLRNTPLYGSVISLSRVTILLITYPRLRLAFALTALIHDLRVLTTRTSIISPQV